MDERANLYLEARRYLWDYFEMHAAQRLKSFNFYLIMCAFVATGYLAVLRDDCSPYVGMVLGGLLVFLSFVFWKLDRRNRDLIQYAEKGLKYIESKLQIDAEDEDAAVLGIFTYEDARTDVKKKRRSWMPASWYLTYARCFNLMFVAIGLLGLAAIIHSAVLALRSTPAAEAGHLLLLV